ncbi:MAG: hypothetical protein M0Z84_11390 [Gammaproteobacteria bacterium]|nr:hypothetical protein [Gammaproteobacteria bacterium]
MKNGTIGPFGAALQKRKDSPWLSLYNFRQRETSQMRNRTAPTTIGCRKGSLFLDVAIEPMCPVTPFVLHLRIACSGYFVLQRTVHHLRTVLQRLVNDAIR